MQRWLGKLVVSMLAVIGLELSSPPVFACASCGSGGDSPLVLYPNEAYKTYLGYTRQQDFSIITAAGKTGGTSGPQRKDILTFAGGFSFCTDWFATLTIPHVTNWHSGDDSDRMQQRSGLGDPLLSLSWTVLPANIAHTWQPQVQAFANHKRHMSASIYDSDNTHLLDVFGNGFDESKLGLDVWHGTQNIKLGAAQTVQWSHARSIQGTKQAPGLGLRTTLTAGYGLDKTGSKILFGVNREAKERRRIYGAPHQTIADSQERNHSVFATANWMLRSGSDLRLTYTRLAAFGDNKNSFAANSFTTAWMESF